MKPLYLFFVLYFSFSCKKTENNYSGNNICKEQILISSKNGYTKNYYPNSINLESIGHYEKGVLQGFWKYFYRNGNIKAEGHYEKGQKQGYWKSYHKNGRVKSEGHINDCKPSGYWKFYDKKKNLIKEINY
ncbi:hypothetical protein [uncultured Aquimarina sp.]|uniref:toxin-antitoxin system YwqK family antitoxin n=1 Tax=uncultured Aquimarina sp. TaxID=575652 RepID=UPI00263982FD|nr:hypothetical protein [uncultured Aquimarina sp.]